MNGRTGVVVQACTIVIALAAVGVSLWEGLENRRHNRISVKPNITLFEHISDGDDRLGLVLKSTGLGPAVIKNVEIRLDGKVVSDWEALAKHHSVEDVWGEKWPVWHDLTAGDHHMPAGESLEMIGTDRKTVKDLGPLRRLLSERLSLCVTRCSVYQDCEIVALGIETDCEE